MENSQDSDCHLGSNHQSLPQLDFCLASKFAEDLGVSKRTLYNWRDKSDFPLHKIEGRSVVWLSRANDWLARKASQNNSPSPIADRKKGTDTTC